MLIAPMTDVTLERTSPEMEYATVSRWLKREGEQVTAGEVLLEIETDKVTQEVVALVSGVLRTIYAVAGDEVRVGEAMGALDGDPDAGPAAA
jgi:pyruvate/2-oxoglutarate dehydrogenase complex dihydrolipoamide acyltransferase (E2) component